MDQILKILVIDQDANNADNIIRTIKSLGFAVRETIITSRDQFEEVKGLAVIPHIIIQASNIGELSVQDSRSHFKADAHETPIVALCDDISSQHLSYTQTAPVSFYLTTTAIY